MSKIRKYLIDKKEYHKQAIIWNTIASVSNSLQSMLLLLVITRIGSMEDSSIFTIAFAIANLATVVGKYGMRNFQVTDVKQKYTYKEYCFSRVITVFIMVVYSVLYVAYGIFLNNYSSKKAMAILLLCGMRMVEVIEDVIHGRLQQQDRLDISSKIWGIRILIYIFSFSFIYVISRNLLFTMAISLLITVILMVVLNKMVYIEIKNNGQGEWKNTFLLLKECFPLAVSTFLIMYIGNAPKYIIDTRVSDQNQTCFNIVFMPVFVITLLSSFIFNPLLNRLALIWIEKKYIKFMKLVYRQIVVIISLTILAVFFGKIVGLRLLEIIYGVDLKAYLLILLLLMIAGGGLALLNLFNMVLTILRQQNVILIFLGFSSVILFLIGDNILNVLGLKGLCLFYMTIIFALSLALFIFLKIYIRKVKIDDIRNEEKY